MADSGDGPLRAVEIEARRFPIQPEKLDQPPALAFKIADQTLVIHLDHVQRQQFQPVCGKPSNVAAPAAAIGEVVREILCAIAEQLKKQDSAVSRGSRLQ